MNEICPFCKNDPYEYVDIGVGYQAVAVNCCDLGYALFQLGDRKARKVAMLLRSPTANRHARGVRLMREHNGEFDD